MATPEYRYYDLRRNWNRKLKRFAEDPLLLKQLSHDFGKYTYGRWKRKYDPSKRPYDYEGEPLSMPGRKPPWLSFVKTIMPLAGELWLHAYLQSRTLYL